MSSRDERTGTVRCEGFFSPQNVAAVLAMRTASLDATGAPANRRRIGLVRKGIISARLMAVGRHVSDKENQ
jgi:hypothetical protein